MNERIARNLARLEESGASAGEIRAYLVDYEGLSEDDYQVAMGMEPQTGSDLGAIISGLGSRGPAYLAGAPVDLADLALQIGERGMGGMLEGLAGLPEGSFNPYSSIRADRPVGGSQWIMDQMEYAGIPARTEARTGFGRVMSRGAEEVGAAISSMGLGSLIKPLGGMAQRAGTAMTEAPIVQGASSMAAGAGAGIANEISPGDPIASVIGGLLGGLPVAAAGTAISRLGAQASQYGRRAVDLLSPEGRQRLAEHAVRTQASNPQEAAANIGMAQAAGRDVVVPGSLPMGADLADDAGISALTRTLSQDQRSPMLPSYAQRLMDNDFARREALGEIGSQTTPEVAGSVIREGFDQSYDASRAATNAAYDAVRAAGDPDIPTTNALVRAAALMENYYGPGGGAPPTALADIMADLQVESLPFSALQRMRSRAANLAAQASSGANPDRIAASVAGQFADILDGAVDDAARSGAMSGDQIALLRDAQALRAEQGRMFERGPLGPLSQTQAGQPRVQPSAIPGRVTGSYEAAQRAGQVLGEPSQQAIRDYLISNFTDVRRPDGQIGLSEVNRFMRRFDPALRAFREEGLLSAEQADTLDAVITDIRRHSEAMGLGRGTGSPTFQHASGNAAVNEATGGAVGRVFGDRENFIGGMVRSLMRPSFEDIDQRIADILMDPDLLAAAAGRNVDDVWSVFGQLLKDKLLVTGAVTTGVGLQSQAP